MDEERRKKPKISWAFKRDWTAICQSLPLLETLNPKTDFLKVTYIQNHES